MQISGKSCPPCEAHPLEWNLSLVLKNYYQPLYEPLNQVSEAMLTHKSIFLIAFASAKRASEIQGLSYHILHVLDWSSIACHFIIVFVAKTQNLTSSNDRFYSFLHSSFAVWKGETRKNGYSVPSKWWESTQDVRSTTDQLALMFYSWPLEP